MDKFIDQLQAAPVTAYTMLSKAVMAPPKELWGLIGLAVCIASIVSYFLSRYEESAPNEWMLVIKNGEQKKAAVGLKTFVMPNESVVRFPSVIQRVEFKAMNITKEMQGVSIEGYAFWQVYREKDGPFRCYKYMQGYGANDNVKTLCESIVRNELANSHLSDVITKRDQLRDNVKNELMPQLQGWGIWLETVELTEVKICSYKLFEDLQAEFRQETSLTANQKKISTNELLTKNRLASELKMTKTEEESKTQRQIDFNRQELKRKQQEVEFYEKTCALEKKKMENETTLALEGINRDFEINRKKLENEQQNEREKKNFELETMRREIELAKKHTPLTLEKYTIDSNERIYRQLRLGETRINQFVGSDDPKSLSLGCLLPGLTLPPIKE